MPVHKLVVGAMLLGGAAVVLGAGFAHADDVDLNGWTLTQDTAEAGTVQYTLNDPGDSLGFGTQINGTFGPPLSYALDPSEKIDIFDYESNNNGDLPSLQSLEIRDEWLTPSLIQVSVDDANGTTGGASEGFFTTTLGGNEVVDLFNVQANSSSLNEAFNPTTPLIDPDATGPVDINGLTVADPQDGALYNDIYGAVFDGNATDWSHAMTLFGDLFGSSADATSGAAAAAADAVDPSGWLDLFNLF